MLYLAAYIAAVGLFLFGWSRALPRAENTSRLIDREMRRRSMGDVPSLPSEFALHSQENAL